MGGAYAFPSKIVFCPARKWRIACVNRTALETGGDMPITLASSAVSVEVLLAAYRSGGQEILLTENIGRDVPTIPDALHLD